MSEKRNETKGSERIRLEQRIVQVQKDDILDQEGGLAEAGEDARLITPDTIFRLEKAGNEIENLSCVCSLMQQAFIGGKPDPDITQKGLGHIGESLSKIYEEINEIIGEIYRKELK